MKRRGIMLAIGIALLMAGLVSTGFAQRQPTRNISHVAGNLYRAQNNNHFTVLLVTAEGIILSDPINRDFAGWLKTEINTRFGIPVRYVLYSHSDADHASGGEVFADSAPPPGTRPFRGSRVTPPRPDRDAGPLTCSGLASQPAASAGFDSCGARSRSCRTGTSRWLYR